ncbi:hypothetical protein I3843_04G186300 [Carya illinoinensis]|uniref:SAWADEE domain-containing protein n=1 Tax=Carya illinoinensis TaxID=32201 RepID=A0A8T1QV50_CARIL|nr:uncharacterized protein LOC122306695 isoform X1 [Carya illinoinensis]KAG2713869.1 hypothetical protein I3760_04G196100 [Carya illinoinensis]KAG6658958.1 hypothetical protein CIPAW_04G197600 [Carya illinoinensis]KAG6719312.1 hypothetical protein I3842_04G195900 [Carya illinoinensis]KAG7984949.1 hypothetical protein I3843_04G186300 [Carya illinoinensis]
MSSENAVPGNPLGKLDFRATSDDAWYSVMVELDGDIMRLQYCGFSEEHDQVFKASDFKSLSEVDDFEARFRPMSVQVQDSECSKVLQGDVVCTAFSFQHEDVRFYDALVEGVEHREHASKQGQEENEEEECLCTFILLWIHGPNAGNLTATSVESICRVQSSAQIDPKVASFLNIARERFLRNGAPVLISINDESPNINHKLSFFQCLKQEAGHAQLFVNTISEGGIGNHPERTIDEDTDFGGVENQYVILLENLDKGSSPSIVSEFIHRETAISPQVYLFLNLNSDPTTKGALMLDCEKKFQELSDFLDNPNHIILSSSGRPWVIIEKLSGNNILGVISAEIQMVKSQIIFQNGYIGSTNELKVVYLGTEEYQMAKLLKDLFVEFFNHQKQLGKRLAYDVGKILQRHDTV